MGLKKEKNDRYGSGNMHTRRGSKINKGTAAVAVICSSKILWNAIGAARRCRLAVASTDRPVYCLPSIDPTTWRHVPRQRARSSPHRGADGFYPNCCCCSSNETFSVVQVLPDLPCVCIQNISTIQCTRVYCCRHTSALIITI